ncbi:acyl-CoA N-acyltransferase [Auriculariales sp. MPI-PUGE-AT-0066]|nr:acyl-CoA N-acyltransferase [Auriculariales sp. MPI-PUGE-AT-0066]
MSNWKVRLAQASDAEPIAQVESDAFGDPSYIYPRALKDPKEFRAWQMDSNLSVIRDAENAASSTTMTWLVVENTTDSRLAAILRFERVQNLVATPHVLIIDAPFGGPEQAAFLNAMTLTRRKIMGTQPHIYVYVLATHPDYQRRGAASAVLDHMRRIADEDNLPMYLESSPIGVGMYDKMGFKEVGSTGPFPLTHGQVMVPVMVREPDRRS